MVFAMYHLGVARLYGVEQWHAPNDVLLVFVLHLTNICPMHSMHTCLMMNTQKLGAERAMMMEQLALSLHPNWATRRKGKPDQGVPPQLCQART